MSENEMATYPMRWIAGPIIPRGNPVRLADLKPGIRVMVCDHWGCIEAGSTRRVMSDANGLYLKCDNGKHYLDGQEDEADGFLVGVRR